MNWIEGDLLFDFSETVHTQRFDDNTHKLSHCMKAVDFIVETKKSIYFIEVKDPDNPRAENTVAFYSKLTSGNLTKNLTGKYRDSFIYQWAKNALNKPVHYIVLLAMESLDGASLLSQTENLRRNLPLIGSASWKKPIASSCVILSLDSWNQNFKQWPVSRISEVSAQA